MAKVLTISIAAYNVGSCLEKTLSSLIINDDAFDKLEVLIVNDGSSDDTSIVAHKFENLYPDVFKVIDKENGGYGSTINAALKSGTGKYFKLLDGDDWYINSNLSGFIRLLETSEADIVISPYILLNDTNKTELLLDNHVFNSTSISEYYNTSPKKFCMHEMCIRTRILIDNRICFSEKCFYTDNEYVFFPQLYAKTIEKYSEPIYVYRIGTEGQSVSLSGRKKHWRDASIVEKRLLLSFVDNYEGLSDGICSAFRMILRDLAEYQLINYCLIDDADQGQRELIAFDRFIKETDKETYQMISRKNSKILLLRLFRYSIFDIVRKSFIQYYSKM